jgi:hypothetical protein
MRRIEHHGQQQRPDLVFEEVRDPGVLLLVTLAMGKHTQAQASEFRHQDIVVYRILLGDQRMGLIA